MKRLSLMIVAALICGAMFTSCSDDKELAIENEEGGVNNEEITDSYNLRGKAEKGPFVRGTRVSVYELSASFVLTGRSFVVYTDKDDGSFSSNGLKLISPYVLLDVDGFYFNEVSGELSGSRRNLAALLDLRQTETANVNLLTHLERQRVEKLVADGLSFVQAKSQAQQEVLSVFGLSSDLLAEQSELCGNDAVLLTVSSILQGFRTEAELTELLAVFAQDIAQNGELNNSGLLQSLSDDASRLSAAEIRNNLMARYQSLGIEVNIPDIAPALNAFTGYSPPANSGIVYPATGKYGINILSSETDELHLKYNGQPYICSLTAELDAGCSLSVRLYGNRIKEDFDTGFEIITLEQCATWAYEPFSLKGWEFGVWDGKALTQTVTVAGKVLADVPVHLLLERLMGGDYLGTGEIRIELYELVIPTRQV